MNIVNEREVQNVIKLLEKEMGALGFEFYPFKINWYNSCVAPVFQKHSSNDDVIAVTILSTPDMFEKAFLQFLPNFCDFHYVKDPIDECMKFHFSKIKHMFPDLDIEVIHDHELYPNRRPKMLLQTAAHVSGAAYFYQLKEYKVDHKKGLGGVCIHPSYGGWFAIRGVVIFHNLSCPDLPKVYPRDVIPSLQDKLLLLDLFIYQWQDSKYRDIIPVKKRYSELQIKYFSTLPKDRIQLIKEWMQQQNCY